LSSSRDAKSGTKNQDVSSDISHQVLHRALLVATPRIAESAIEKVVASESREMPVLLPVRSLENLGYRRFEVVVNALLGDSAEELEGQTVPRRNASRPSSGRA